jgi:hypothetical protein
MVEVSRSTLAQLATRKTYVLGQQQSITIDIPEGKTRYVYIVEYREPGVGQQEQTPVAIYQVTQPIGQQQQQEVEEELDCGDANISAQQEQQQSIQSNNVLKMSDIDSPIFKCHTKMRIRYRGQQQQQQGDHCVYLTFYDL